jgi:translation initiation factor 1
MTSTTTATNSVIVNLQPQSFSFDDDIGEKAKQIHIMVHQRNARKTITSIQGLPDDLDLQRIMKTLRKNMCCNGSLADNDKVIQLQGDHRSECAAFLVDEEICTKEQIKIHGA